jgi:hypothetical protein
VFCQTRRTAGGFKELQRRAELRFDVDAARAASAEWVSVKLKPSVSRRRRRAPAAASALTDELAAFNAFGTRTEVGSLPAPGAPAVPVFLNEFWTAKQRAAHSLHEVSYRACFKPQLPRFFIERLTRPGDRVYDPFMGRGTTLIEAALLGRMPLGCDLNALSPVLVRPRLEPPAQEAVARRLDALDLDRSTRAPDDLLVFYHPQTLREIAALRAYLLQSERAGTLDAVDRWIRLVAVNRLTGHSAGFFSVYTLPPNQATSVQAQRRINQKRRQTPPRRDVKALILKKSRQLLADLTPPERARLARAARAAQLLTASAEATPEIGDDSVQLIVTSPPFLDVVNYRQDNWLRAWFCGLDTAAPGLWQFRRLADWQEAITRTLRELRRVLAPGGHVAFEVGEVRRGRLELEQQVLAAGTAAGLTPVLVLINRQAFTKTANCWGVTNLARGTNTNRVVVFTKPR